ncbi:TatD family hydrolase [Candidatus Pacearchaeota archaeon]|nr:TatD family hydrolase [Candidatus Pacearchaeota archaeon]
MVFIDTHCHIDYYEKDKIEGIVENAKKAGVKIMLNAGSHVESIEKTLELVNIYKEVKAVLGIFPIDSIKLSAKELEAQIENIRENKDIILAIGEVGIDLKESSDLESQEKTFQKFIDLAIELDKPIIIHSRKAEAECIELLEKSGHKKIMMHCFCGKRKLVEKIRDNGWYLSIPTSVNNSEQFQDMIRNVPIEQLLCETDSPFLHPLKERNNEPANVIYSYKKIAEIKELSLEEVEKQLEENFNKLFLL